jgi:hypothetical protein
MIHNSINKVLTSLKLTKADRNEIELILNRPEVRNVLYAHELDAIEHRKALIKELKAIAPNSEKLKAQAAKERIEAEKRFELAEAEYYAAREALRVAQNASNYVDYGNRQRATQIEHELIASSDPRIADFRHELGKLNDRARTKCQYWFGHGEKDWFGRSEVIQYSNIGDVSAARSELGEGLAMLHELALSALTHGEISQKLRDLSNALKGPLRKLEMNPPTLDENDAVKAPDPDGFVSVEKLN